MKTKVCTKCGEEKEVHQFNKDISRKDGWYVYCKQCRKKYREENKDEIEKRRKKAYYANHEEKKRKQRIRSRRWYYSNLEHARKKSIERTKKHIEKYPERKRAQYEKERDNLMDTYIRKIIQSKLPISYSDIPQWMVDDKRAELKIYRKIKTERDGQKES